MATAATKPKPTLSRDISPLKPEIIDRYIYGWCWFLADELHNLTGWPVEGVGDKQYFKKREQRPLHVFVITPEGYCLDSTGASTRDEMAARYTAPWPTHLRKPKAIVAPINLASLDRGKGIGRKIFHYEEGHAIRPARRMLRWYRQLKLPPA